jgi:hypothetical protein
MVELSHAVKCPNIAYHLVGAKKVRNNSSPPPYLSSPPFISSHLHPPLIGARSSRLSLERDS